MFWKPNFILGMPKPFGLEKKQLLTSDLCLKRFGIPKMKLDFQKIGWKSKSSSTEYQKPSADM